MKLPVIRDARGNELKVGDVVYVHLNEPLILAMIAEGPRRTGNGRYEFLLRSQGLVEIDPADPITWVVEQGLGDMFDQTRKSLYETEAEAREAARMMFGIEKSDKGYTVM